MWQTITFQGVHLLLAANRGQYVVENFQQSPAVADGLAVMAQAYHMMGKPKMAQNSVKVLAANYPDYPLIDGDQFDFESRPLFPSNWLLNKLNRRFKSEIVPPAFDTRTQYNLLPQ
jgi:outer membrane protein assembly factor BamD